MQEQWPTPLTNKHEHDKRAHAKSQGRALDRRLSTAMMVSVSRPTLTAAYSECGVSTYSCTHSGRHTGSAMAIRKSYAWRYTGENVSRKMRPSGHTHSGLRARGRASRGPPAEG